MQLQQRNPEYEIPFWRVRAANAVWGQRPGMLSHFDTAAYLALGRALERVAQQQEHSPWVLDLGTYFGRSAFAFLQGATMITRSPKTHVLSCDLFAFDSYLLQTPKIIQFQDQYGPPGPASVRRWLDELAPQIGLSAASNIWVQKKDVVTLTADELCAIAPAGFEIVAIDCGKTPQLMNNIARLLTDPRVAHPGTILYFQDLFDWHAPWNLYTFWQWYEAGFIRVKACGPRVGAIGEIIASADGLEELPCNQILPAKMEAMWCTPYTDFNLEMQAFAKVKELFQRAGLKNLALLVDCLSVGALLRAGELALAEKCLRQLDAVWPLMLEDKVLQNAYCRLMHLRTGQKDLSLVLRTRYYERRHAKPIQELRRAVRWARYLTPCL